MLHDFRDTLQNNFRNTGDPTSRVFLLTPTCTCMKDRRMYLELCLIKVIEG